MPIVNLLAVFPNLISVRDIVGHLQGQIERETDVKGVVGMTATQLGKPIELYNTWKWRMG
jgi:hypothetical protein